MIDTFDDYPHFNMLARCLQMQGKAAAWRRELGDEKTDPWCREAIGDFGAIWCL